jgi:hypothetical protein
VDVNVKQVATEVRALTGAEIQDMIRGRVTISQKGEKVDTMLGVKIGTIR